MDSSPGNLGIDVGPIKAYLDPLVTQFETVRFIDDDPISVPHAFDSRGDQEVIGLFAALLAWGQRRTILAKMADLCERMDNQPFNFVANFNVDRDAERLIGFKHRTFNASDAVWLIGNLSLALREHRSIEALFNVQPEHDHIGPGIERFSSLILNPEFGTPNRLRKHVARPSTGSACKRLSMYVRWMTRPGPFDLGLWKSVSPRQLIAPLDVHSGRQARELGLLRRKANDWRAAIELTESCRLLSASDPIRYDLALFGIGANRLTIPSELLIGSGPNHPG